MFSSFPEASLIFSSTRNERLFANGNIHFNPDPEPLPPSPGCFSQSGLAGAHKHVVPRSEFAHCCHRIDPHHWTMTKFRASFFSQNCHHFFKQNFPHWSYRLHENHMRHFHFPLHFASQTFY